MYRSIYDLKDFYASPSGQMVKRVIGNQIRAWWNDVKAMRVVGIGYAQPYLNAFLPEAERVIAINPAGKGIYPWPDEQQNLAALAEESELPIESNSVDRVLMVHALENAELLRSNLQEVWRILKSNGRLIVVTPNRRGFWARAEWSPFGQGTPYSRDQLRFFLRDNLFVYEQSCSALYTPPLRWDIIRQSSDTCEKILPYILPGMGGVHIVEASKQLYSGIAIPSENKVIARGRHGALPNPVPSARILNRLKT